MERQFGDDRSHRVWNRCQRMERIQELFNQDGHVSIRLHDLRKDGDRIEKLCQGFTHGKIRWISHQDADVGRYHYGPDTPCER